MGRSRNNPGPPRGPFTLNRRSRQANGLVFWAPLYHPFNAGQNAHLVDLSLYSKKIPNAVAGTPLYQPSDIFGMTTCFNTEPDTLKGYFPIPDAPYLRVSTGAFALSVWINVNTASLGAAGSSIIYVDQGGNFIGLDLAADGGIGFDISDGTNTATVAFGASLLNTGWRHIFAVRGGGRLRLWVDGKSQGNVADTTGDLGFTWGSPTQWVLLSNVNLTANSVNCPVADLRIYNGPAFTQTVAGALNGWLAGQIFNPATRFDLCKPL